MSTNTAYDEGYDAYRDGVDVTDNPYDEDAEEHRFWEECRRQRPWLTRAFKLYHRSSA
jgi:hypothetical protein